MEVPSVRLSQGEKVVSLVAHLLVMGWLLGLLINAVLFMTYRNRSTFAARHIKQALGVQLVNIVALLVVVLSILVGFPRPIAGLIFAFYILIMFGSAIVAMVHSVRGEEFTYPLVGRALSR